MSSRLRFERLRHAWSRRRIHFTRAGAIFTIGTLAVGFAAVNTGNNLLHLLLGAMLGLVVLSGWFSERVLRGLVVRRRFPRAVTAGEPFRGVYEVCNRNRRIPSFAVDVREKRLGYGAFLVRVSAGGSEVERARIEAVAPKRGIVPLDLITLSTSFPFGLFRKERDLLIPEELVVWPRTDGAVAPIGSTRGRSRRGVTALVRAGAVSRGEYRSLREYRPGDDPRDVHWRTSARRGAPIVREYERDAGETVWIVLDVGQPPGDAAETAAETAASTAAFALRAGRRVGLDAGRWRVQPDRSPGHLIRILDTLARVEFSPGELRPGAESRAREGVTVVPRARRAAG